MSGTAFLLLGVAGVLLVSIFLIYRTTKNKPKKLLYFFLVLFLSLFLVGLFLNNAVDSNARSVAHTPSPRPIAPEATPGGSKPTPLPAEYALPDDVLKDMVKRVEPVVVDCAAFQVFILGASLQKSTGSLAEDSLTIGNGLVTEIQELSRQFDIALSFEDTNSKQLDCYLTLYIAIEIKSQNGDAPFVPRMELSAIDDKNRAFKLIHYSYNDLVLDQQFPYGIILFKCNYDANTAEISLGDTVYKLDLSILK